MLSTYDTQRVSEVLNGEIGDQYVQRLKRLYKAVTGENVLSVYKGEMALIDENSEKFATDIALKLNMHEAEDLMMSAGYCISNHNCYDFTDPTPPNNFQGFGRIVSEK